MYMGAQKGSLAQHLGEFLLVTFLRCIGTCLVCSDGSCAFLCQKSMYFDTTLRSRGGGGGVPGRPASPVKNFRQAAPTKKYTGWDGCTILVTRHRIAQLDVRRSIQYHAT